MNRETRTFIFGLIVLFTSAIGVAIHICEMNKGLWTINSFNTITFSFSVAGLWFGASKITDTIN